MSERLRKGSRQFVLLRRSDRRSGVSGRRLKPREAVSFVRSLHSRAELTMLRRLTAGSATGFTHDQGLLDRVAALLDAGQLEIWSVDGGRGAGRRRERELDDDEAPPIEPPDTQTVVIELVDKEGNPVPFEPYRIKLPDGRLETRTLDRHGRDRITGIREAGQCMVCFHRRDASVWSRA
ncbi:MAG: hypothetical protein R6X02_15270 [Enhygromyxa sp.]